MSTTASNQQARAFYKRLGVSSTAGTDDIRRAFKALAMKYHPDRPGGNAVLFKELNEAHEILVDDVLRPIYDQHDIEGVLQARATGMTQKPKCPPVQTVLKITLEQLYQGIQDRPIAVPRRRCCPGCQGTGAIKNDAVASLLRACLGCQGRGQQIVNRIIGPGMMQQSQMVCDQCKGDGHAPIPAHLQCQTCQGKRIITLQDPVLVNVPRGAPNGYTIILSDEGEQLKSNISTGDLHFKVEQVPHATFRREHNNLYVTHTLTLLEALVGGSFELAHLDGSMLKLHLPKETVIRPGTTTCVPDRGMPDMRDPSRRGKLLISFDVLFPTAEQLALPGDKRELLQLALSDIAGRSHPPASPLSATDPSHILPCEELELESINVETEKQQQTRDFAELQQHLQQQAEMQNGQHPHRQQQHTQHVQCAQQ